MRSLSDRGVWLFFGCLAFFFVGNGVTALLMSGLWPNRAIVLALYPARIGMIGGQVAIHGVWFVFARLPWPWRILAGAASAILLFGAYLAPLLPDNTVPGDIDYLAATLLCLPLFLLAAQTPLWTMRIWFRWRITHRDDAASGRYEPMGIGALLLAMSAVASALAAARLSRSIDSPRGNGSIGVLVVGALVIVVVSAATVLPAVLAGLRARRLPLTLGLAFAADVGVVAVYLSLRVILGGGWVEWEVFVVVPVLVAGFFVTLTAPLLIARRLGYRLLWGRG